MGYNLKKVEIEEDDEESFGFECTIEELRTFLRAAAWFRKTFPVSYSGLVAD